MKLHYLNFAGLCLTGLSLTACSPTLTQFLQNMDVSVTPQNTAQNTDEYINLTAVVSLGNVSVSGISIPIKDPKTGGSLGLVTFGENAAGKSTIGLSLDATTISKGDATLGSTLPNGKALPFGLATTYGDVFAVPILQDSRVYIGGDLRTKIIIGVALGISALDGIESQVGGAANIFFSHSFSTSILGMGGIYGSTSPGESGIAVFAQYTPPVAAPTPVTITSTGSGSTTGTTTGSTTGTTGSTTTGSTTTTSTGSTTDPTSGSTSGGTNTINGRGAPSTLVAFRTTSRSIASVSTATTVSAHATTTNAARPTILPAPKLAPDAQQMDSVTSSSNEKIYNYFYGKRKVLKVH